MLVLAAMLMGIVASGAMQEPGAPATVAQPIVTHQEQQGTQPVVSRDTVPSAATEGKTPEAKPVFIVPAGTKIPLTLARAINPKRSRKGDAVRAVTAFPVTVDGQVAMPAGVLMEGVVDKLVKKDRWGHPWVQVHFTRMVFPNGYVLPLEGESSEARAGEPGEGESADARDHSSAEHEDGPSAEEAFQFPAQQTQPPTLPPLPKPNYGPAIGLGIGGAAAAIAIAVIAAHHRYDYFWYEAGWQFDMVLQSPLKVEEGNWSGDEAH